MEIRSDLGRLSCLRWQHIAAYGYSPVYTTAITLITSTIYIPHIDQRIV